MSPLYQRGQRGIYSTMQNLPVFPFTKGRDLDKVTVRHPWLQNFYDNVDYIKYLQHKMNME
jgi:hypothetical protein